MNEISPIQISDSISTNSKDIHETKFRHKMLSSPSTGDILEFSSVPQVGSKTIHSARGNDDDSVAMNLVERSGDSGIKAVSSGFHNIPDIPSPFQQAAVDQTVHRQHNEGVPVAPPGVLLPSLAGPAPEPLLVMSASKIKNTSTRKNSSSRSSPKKGSHRTSSSAASIDMVAPSPARTPARELDRLHVENRAPPRFICPISGRIMRDPVILGTGTTCDRSSLEQYLAQGNKRCPVTKRPLKKPIHTMPNMELRNNIALWAKRNAPWILDSDGCLRTTEPDLSDLQGKDIQYIMPIADSENAPSAGHNSSGGNLNRSGTLSRIESGKSNWKYTNGTKVRPGAVNYNINANATSASPWQNHRGIASAPRSMRGHRPRSISPAKKTKPKRDWYSTGFMAAISLTNLILFIMSLMKNDWKMVPMSTNPWYGASAEALAAVGAEVLPLMEVPGKQFWRIFSSMFLPAGVIHLLITLSGLWVYGRYAQLALPLPQVSVAGVYLLSALVGAIASANLNAYYVSCGALAGVIGLLATVCADQALHFKTKKLFNFKEWYLVAFLLLVNIGALITASLLPMISVWYMAVAFVAGLLLSVSLLCIEHVGRGKPNNAKWASAQITCAIVLIGGFTAAVVGLALPTKVGENASLLKNGSCVDFGSMSCIQYGYLSTGCGASYVSTTSKAVLTSANATGLPPSTIILGCPGLNSTTSSYMALPEGTTLKLGDPTQTSALCSQYCSGANNSTAAGPAGVPTTTIIVPTTTAVSSAPGQAPGPSTTTSQPVIISTNAPVTTIYPTPPAASAAATAAATTVANTVVPQAASALGSNPGAAIQTATNALSNAGRKLRAGSRRM